RNPLGLRPTRPPQMQYPATRFTARQDRMAFDQFPRRAFPPLPGGAAAPLLFRPRAARAQQPAPPVIGFLHQGSPEPPALTNAFREGLSETGIDGRSITIENRWANGHYERLPDLAADLVGHHVAIIAANFPPAALAAKAATQTIPIVFLSGSDPIAAGLVSSFNRPTGNVTGIAPMFTLLGSKNLELLRELVPKVGAIGILLNPSNPNAEPQLRDLQAAARVLGQELVVLRAAGGGRIDGVLASLADRRFGALLVPADGFLISRRDQLVVLAARHALPTMYPLSQYVAAGGLISYGASLSDAFR